MGRFGAQRAALNRYEQSTLNRKLESEQRHDKGTSKCQQYLKQPKPEISEQGQHLVKIGEDVDKKPMGTREIK